MPIAVITISEAVFTASPKRFLRKIYFTELLIENIKNKGKFMANYLFNQTALEILTALLKY